MVERKTCCASAAALLLGTLLFAATPASALEIIVKCDDKPVGKIDVSAKGKDKGISGDFTSTVGGPPPTLADAAKACNEDHFNWYQVVTADNGKAKDASGKFLTPPYVDPPPDGYSDQWADKLPWYYDEGKPPADAKNVDPNLSIEHNTSKDKLHFGDNPTSSGDISFMTWLVSLNKDGSFHAFEGGFSWKYLTASGTVEDPKVINGDPPDKYYKDIIGKFATSVPEPSMLWLMAFGVAGLALFRRGKFVIA